MTWIFLIFIFCQQFKKFHKEIIHELEKKTELDVKYMNVSAAFIHPGLHLSTQPRRTLTHTHTHTLFCLLLTQTVIYKTSIPFGLSGLTFAITWYVCYKNREVLGMAAHAHISNT